MDATVPRVSERRVHVAPLGHEPDRIVEPLPDRGADVVYPLADAPDRSLPRLAVGPRRSPVAVDPPLRAPTRRGRSLSPRRGFRPAPPR